MRESNDMATTDDTSSPKAKRKPAAPRKPAARKAVAAPKAALTITEELSHPDTPLREQASAAISKLQSTAKDAMATGKDRTAEALDDVQAMIEDVAQTIDARVGPKYGAYAHKAADALSNMSTSLKSKDVEDLLEEARDFVRRRPAITIGGAAALGFLVARLLKADPEDKA
jgi:ElaB/YqjD/DUF883 family membrane-anchored ribosome-binding protein